MGNIPLHRSVVIIAAVMFGALSSPVCFGRRLPDSIVRVGVAQRVKSFNLSCGGNYHIYELASGRQSSVRPLDDYLVRAKGNEINIDGHSYSTPSRIISEAQNDQLRINGRRYRDSVLITAKDSVITVINELGIEDYLRGILPREANPAWPFETLKAQAVISRTYALRNLHRHGAAGFDLCTETHCQVFGGVESEDERTSKAVEETRGEVLVFDGEMAQTLFHAACGGHTEDPNNVWGWGKTAPRYLRGRSDGYCADSPHNAWKNLIGSSFIKARLRKAGYDVGDIRDIKIDGRYPSGRARAIRVIHEDGALKLSSNSFRLAVEPWLVKSTMITGIAKKKDGFEFRGKGWGHGVGLCQWGTKIMGEKGKNYRDMLKFYYPGTDVETWEE